MTPVLNKPARYRWAALQMIKRANEHYWNGRENRAWRCIFAARRLNDLAFRAA